MTIQRCCFTRAELKNLAGLSIYDKFIAEAYVPEDFDESVDIQSRLILVQRNGSVTNRYSDGTIGVPEEYQQLAEEDECPCTAEGTYADNWRNCEVDDFGNIITIL